MSITAPNAGAHKSSQNIPAAARRRRRGSAADGSSSGDSSAVENAIEEQLDAISKSDDVETRKKTRTEIATMEIDELMKEFFM